MFVRETLDGNLEEDSKYSRHDFSMTSQRLVLSK